MEKEGQNSKENHSQRKTLTFGQKAADSLALFAGSWTFILLFVGFLIVWMIFNGYVLLQYYSGEPFDPYPFILLNLILSCLAALQAPIILMSQNRQAERDRVRSEYDYTVDRKAEREICAMQGDINKIKHVLYEMHKDKLKKSLKK